MINAVSVANPLLHRLTRSRREVTLRTGRSEERLYSCFIYTDGPVFQCVGFARFIRLLTCWHEVTTMVGLRMAIAEKRQAGSSVLWTGLRLHGTCGVASIPPPKRTRAIAKLKRVAAGGKMRLDDAQSLAGLLEHLLPWTGELRAAMYHFYYPHRAFAGLSPQHPFVPPTPCKIKRAVGSRASSNVLASPSLPTSFPTARHPTPAPSS